MVLALPRGGVLVAAEVARALEAPLDLILVRKVGVPFQPELAMGAVVDGGAAIVVRNEDVIAHAGIGDAEFAAACDSELAEIERRRELYVGNSERAEIAGRTAIVVDDGVATGATTRAALRATRLRHPLRLVLGVPVAPTDSLAELRAEADDVSLPRALRNVWCARLLLPRFSANRGQGGDRDPGTIPGDLNEPPRQAFEK